MTNQSKHIREEMLKAFKNNQDFEKTVVAEIDGCNFSGAEIAFLDSNNNSQVYRIIIVKHS